MNPLAATEPAMATAGTNAGPLKPAGKRGERAALDLPRSTRRDAITFAILLSFIIGITASDNTGVARNASVFEASNIYRVAVFAVISAFAARLILFTRTSLWQNGSASLYSVYGAAAIASLVAGSSDFTLRDLRVYYSLFEWLIFILVGCVLFCSPKLKGIEARLELLRVFLVSLSTTTCLIVIAIAFVSPELAFFPRTDLSLGGFVIHPNKLSVVCALGIAGWLANRRSRLRLPVALLLLAIAALTGSTSGTALSILAFAHGLINLAPRSWNVPLYMVVALAVIAVIAVGLGGAVDFASLARAGDLTNLNGRDAVWRATFYMLSERPWAGWGWLDGPALIGHFTGQDWWFSRNAQNDVLNFAVSGGLITGAIALFIYMRILVLSILLEFSPEKRLFTICGFIVILSSLVEPIASSLANSVGFVWLTMALIGGKSSLMKIRRN